MLKIITFFFIANLACANNLGTTNYVYDPIDEVVRGKEVPSHVLSLSFDASLDPQLIHSHKIKMNWSKNRHSEDYDPADPNALEEPEDMKKRPTVCYTFVLRLANLLFTSLASNLPLEEARKVMVWKNEEAMDDMNPTCRTISRKHPKLMDEEEHEVKVSDYDHLDQTCNIDFLMSLFPYYGIGFNLTVTISNKPMTDLSYDDIVKRTTPNKRGATLPIRTTDATVNILLMSPDFTSEKINSASFQRKRHHKVLESNVEAAVETLIQKTQILFGGAIPVNILKKNLGTMMIDLESIPDFHKVDDDSPDEEEKVSNDDFKIDEYIWEICEDHKLSLDECKSLQKHINEEMDIEDDEITTHTEYDEIHTEMNSQTKVTDTERSRPESSNKRLYNGRQKVTTKEEKVRIQQEFEALDEFIDSLENSEPSVDEKNVDSDETIFRSTSEGVGTGGNIEKLEALVKKIHLAQNDSLDNYDVDDVETGSHDEL